MSEIYVFKCFYFTMWHNITMRIKIVNTTSANEKLSTSKGIEKLALSEQQRNRALADLAAANTLVGAFFAASKLLHRR
jgi:hypothetical protein